MWEKLWVPAVTSAVSFGLVAMMPQDYETKSDEKVLTKAIAKTVDPSEELGDIYQRLRKIRSERLAERPKALSDQAAKLYRQAVEAVEAGEPVKARAFTVAAREVTKALELSLKSRREEPADPDLPPPPNVKSKVNFVYRLDSNVEQKLPPTLTEGDKTTKSYTLQPSLTKGFKIRTPDGDAKGETNIRILKLNPDGPDGKREVVIGHDAGHQDQIVLELNKVVTEANEELKTAKDKASIQILTARKQAEAARAAANQAHREVAEALRLKLKAAEVKKPGEKFEIELSKSAVDHMKNAESVARLHESLAGFHSKLDDGARSRVILEKRKSGDMDHEAALAELQRAYETITTARKEHKEGDTTYLDAARDLYHSARREAEAKHFERAAELAKAAEALTKATNALGNVKVETRIVEGKRQVTLFNHKPGEVEMKGNVRVEIVNPNGEAIVKGEKMNPHEVKVFTRKMVGQDGKDQVQIEVSEPKEVKGEPKKDAKPNQPKSDVEIDEAGEVVGIGVMISFEDGKAIVDDFVAEGPAGKDGRIKKGDAILGVETQKGATVGFADKSIADVAKILRGPAGSKVKLIIWPKGTDDRKVYEIERKKLEIPKDSSPKGGGGLPPIID